MHKAFSIEESLRFGWEKTKTHSMLLFQVMLTLFAIGFVSNAIDHDMHNTAIGALARLILSVVGVVIGTGLISITLKIARGEQAVYRDIMPQAPVVWGVFLASLLSGILTFAGFILLIVPGVYFALRFSMVRFEVLDGASVMESFERSTKLTYGHKGRLLGFIIVFIVLNMIGAVLLGLGLLITVPVTMIAFAHIYLKLKSFAHEHAHHDTHEHHEHPGHTHEGHEHHDHAGHDHSH